VDEAKAFHLSFLHFPAHFLKSGHFGFWLYRRTGTCIGVFVSAVYSTSSVGDILALCSILGLLGLGSAIIAIKGLWSSSSWNLGFWVFGISGIWEFGHWMNEARLTMMTRLTNVGQLCGGAQSTYFIDYGDIEASIRKGDKRRKSPGVSIVLN
jgi:hypothetical protein